MVWGDNKEQIKVDNRQEFWMEYLVVSLNISMLSFMSLGLGYILKDQIGSWAIVIKILWIIFIIQISIMAVIGVIAYITTILKIRFYEKQEKN